MTDTIHEKLTDASGVYFNATLVERRQTPFQVLEVYDTPELGRIFRLDGFNMTSERDEFLYHEPLVHPASIAHPNPRRALVIGGGDGGSAEEFLKHATIERVHMAELDPDVIAIAKAQFSRVHRGAFDDPRMAVTVGDGLAYLRETSVRYDVIAMDLTDPVGPSVALYSPETFALTKRAMADGGALVLHVGSPFFHPQRVKTTIDSLRAVFRIVAPYFVHIPLYGAWWGFACASDWLDPRALSVEEADRRIAARGLRDLQFYNGEMHRAIFAQPNYVRALLA